MAAIAATLLAPDAIDAQTDASKFPTSTGFSIGADFLTAHPRGQLKQNAGTGFGFGGHGLLGTDKWGIGGVRIDAGMIRYGMETKRYPCGQFCYYEATTTNDIINLQVGGQIVMPRNMVLPYIGASYGMLWFTSNSQIETESDNPSPFRHNVESGDATSSYMIAGGFYFPLGGAFAGLTANLGMRLFTGGHARYLTPKSLTQDADGNYHVTAYQSDTEFLVVHIGVSSSMGVKK
jgi:hypothetical protein